MSLIDEALKRAQEAGASESRSPERPWVPAPMPDPGLARAARLRRILGALCLAAAAAGAVYLFVRSPAAGSAASPAPGAVPTSTSAAIAVEIPTALPVVIVPTPPRTRSAAVRAKPAEAAEDAPPAAAAAPTPKPAPPPKPGSARTYAGSVTLPSGEKIELGGIAWSEEEPRALLNDRIVGVGGYVEGYSVSKIETDRVELQKDGAKIVLTVK